MFMKMRLFFFLSLCFLFFNSTSAQQPQIYKCFCDKGGLCSSSLVLYADSSYVYEHGCEASSHLSFGEWRKKKDSIYFTQPNPKLFSVIKTIRSSIVPGDSIWVTVLDRKGIDMTPEISMGLDVEGRGSYLFSTDSTTNRQVVYKRNAKSISLRTLTKLLGQRISFPLNGANSFIITLNISTNWIWNKHADWSAFGNFAAVKRGDSLLFLSKIFSCVFDLEESGK
jgi:hypothetical protein